MDYNRAEQMEKERQQANAERAPGPGKDYYTITNRGNPVLSGQGGSPTPSDTITSALDEQMSFVGDLHRALNDFENHLSTLLTHNSPSPAEKIAEEPPMNIAQRIRYHNAIVSLAIQRINSLNGRLQL